MGGREKLFITAYAVIDAKIRYIRKGRPVRTKVVTEMSKETIGQSQEQAARDVPNIPAPFLEGTVAQSDAWVPVLRYVALP